MLDKAELKITWFEVGFIVGVAVVVDFIEFVIEWLDLTGIGILVAVVVTGLIDIVFALGILTYCLIRGIKLSITQIISILGAFLFELLPVVGGAPLWTIDVVYIMLSAKGEESKAAAFAAKIVSLIPSGRGRKGVGGIKKAPPGAKPPVINPPKASPGALPPIIGTSGRPMAEAGTMPPRISDIKPPVIATYGKTPPPIPQSTRTAPPTPKLTGSDVKVQP